jgi:heat shock protein HslJ
MLMRIVSLAAIMLLSACAGRAANDADQVAPGGASPEGVTWRLAEVAGHAAHGTADRPTLRLDAAEHRATGNTGCNGYSGPYELRGDSLRFGALVSTRRACVAEEMNRQEGELMRALEAARTWRIEADGLIMEGPAGAARFTR